MNLQKNTLVTFMHSALLQHRAGYFEVKLFLLLLLSAFTQISFGREKPMIIPFKLTKHNNISVQAILNETDTVNLMFHTAASSVTLIESAAAKIKSIKFAGQDTVKSWGGESAARFSSNNSIHIGKIKFSNISIWENKHSGQETDGKFGMDLFKDKVIKIDFEKNVLIVSSALPGNMKKYEKHKLAFENEMMFLEASLRTGDAVLKNAFLLHSGYSGSLLLDDKFVNDNKIDQALKVTGEKKLQDSYGNTIKTIQAVLPLFKIGSMELTNVPVGFFSGSLGMQKISVIGGDVLKRFTIIIDSKRGYIYLKPNKLKTENYSTS